MELRVYNENLEALGVIDQLSSVIWDDTYWQAGQAGTSADVKIQAPITDQNIALLVKRNIIVRHDESEYSDSDGKWHRAVQIQYIHIEKNEKGEEELEIHASLLKQWLTRRVVASAVNMTDTSENIVYYLVNTGMSAGASAERKISKLKMLNQLSGGSSVTYAPEQFSEIAKEVEAQATLGAFGYDILVNEETGMYGFWMFRGSNLSSGNTDGNNPCIFSVEYDNVTGQEYTDSIEDYKNVCYAVGKEYNSESAVPYLLIGTATGMDRYEVKVDVDTDWTYTDSSGTDQKYTVAQYQTFMQADGEKKLAEYIESRSFESTINPNSNLVYRKDFRVGDIVTCVRREWGVQIDVRIIKAERTWEDGKVETEITFGDAMPTLIQKIRRLR